MVEKFYQTATRRHKWSESDYHLRAARAHDFIPLRYHPRWIALAQRLGRTAPFVWD